MAGLRSRIWFGAKTAASQRNEDTMTTRRRMDSGQRPEVLAVAELMMTTSIDQIATYDDMSRVAGCDVRQKRWIVLRAKTC